MKKTLGLCSVATLLFLAAPAVAAEAVQLPLGPPPMLVAEICRTPVWSGLPVIWKGVADRRPDLSVGVQIQGDKEPLPVFADPPLAGLFDSALRELFRGCGMRLVEEQSEGRGDAIVLSAEIREFYVGVEKRLLTGKSRAQSSIAFAARKGGQSTSVTVGFEIDAKKIRSGKLKQLQGTLNELFAETLKQIVATPEMRELK